MRLCRFDRETFAVAFASLGLAIVLGPACGWSQDSPPASSDGSPTAATSNQYFDPAPRQLVTGFTPGIGGNMACGSETVVFTDGPMHTIYATGRHGFSPHKLMDVNGKIGPISMAGSWVAFTAYAQAGDQISPLAAWTVYGINLATGRTVALATGSNAVELRELPFPTVGDGFIVWDALAQNSNKVLMRYDEGSGAIAQLTLPPATFPVYPSASGGMVLFLDNSGDPGHASETWLGRGGEPLVLDTTTGKVSRLAAGAVVFDAVLTPRRAVWIAVPNGSTSYEIQEVTIPGGGSVRALSQTETVAPLWANANVTVWLGGSSGTVTADVGGRIATASPDLTDSPGGMALCDSDLYYAGPNLSLRVAHLS
jgi:hypothetical protein